MPCFSGLLAAGLAKPSSKALDNLNRSHVPKELCDEQVSENPAKPEEVGRPGQVSRARLVDRKSSGAAQAGELPERRRLRQLRQVNVFKTTTLKHFRAVQQCLQAYRGEATVNMADLVLQLRARNRYYTLY